MLAPGALWAPGATTFVLDAPCATRVELIFFEPGPRGPEQRRLDLVVSPEGRWTASVPGVPAGQHYGYRVHGQFDPAAGHRCNPAKLLLDPAARAISGPVAWHPVLADAMRREDGTLVANADDSAPYLPRSIVIDPAFDWQGDRRPDQSWANTVIYECHVRGMTMQHPGVPEHERGTYLGLTADPVLDHLLKLGVTAVQLLPVHHMGVEHHLVELGLPNYWGYSTIGYFAPDARLATGADGRQVGEFKEMVRRLHSCGLEVYLDVVYNHTAEGGDRGGVMSFRGIDNAAFYRLGLEHAGHYIDFTGTGNTLNLSDPLALELVLASLRYWATEMHVDGFRFDLAVTLGRNAWGDFDPAVGFFEAVRHDPVLRGCKLIAEPWDLGPGGFRLGGFPLGWSEWNGAYRDSIRRFWQGIGGQADEFASRLAGSADLFQADPRTPQASVNYITCHDGFTLADLVSYEHKHNEANGENNRDGTDQNWSRNWGVEGPTADPSIRSLRDRVRRSMILSLACSQGVPMLAHGDELGRTQEGNNNAYCQDGPLSWVQWTPSPENQAFLEFVCRAMEVRAGNSVFRRTRFEPPHRKHSADVEPAEPEAHDTMPFAWLKADGSPMTEGEWQDPDGKTLVVLLHQDAGGGGPAETALLALNNAESPLTVTLPRPHEEGWWEETLHAARASVEAAAVDGDVQEIPPYCAVLYTWKV